MILAPPRNLQSVGALESGKTVLLIEPSASAGGNPAVTLDWELRARPDSGGRSFALGLPGDETTELTLELPAGWLPLGPEGFREGPLPSSQTGFQSWRFHGRPELINLRLLDGRKPLPPGEESLIWVSGPTRIMLGSTESRDAQSANWKTDWTVQPDRRGLMRFTVELGPGLEFIAVSGPEVKEYQAEHEGEVTRVRVTLAGISRLPTPLHFEAHARVPLEGLWSVPAMRPLDAIWTGGTTTVVVDPLRVIQDCRELRRPARARTGRRAGRCERARLRGQIGRSGRGPRVPSDTGSAGVPGTWPAAGRPGGAGTGMSTDRGRRPWPHKGAEHRVATDLGSRSRGLERRGRIACLASDHSGGWQHPAARAPSRRRGCPGRPSPRDRSVLHGRGRAGPLSCRESVPPVWPYSTRPGWPWWTGR